MTPARIAAALGAASLLALAACESDDDARLPPPTAAGAETAPAPYIREATSPDLALAIRIPAAARALPGVGERLIADAEAEAADAARRAAERRRERADLFRPSELWIEWSIAYDARGAVSLLGETYLDEGAAEPIQTRATVVFDRAAGREVGFADLFADPRPNAAAMTAVSDAAFAAWAAASPQAERGLALVDERTMVDVRESLRPRAASFERFVLIADEDDASRIAGLSLLYERGLLGARAEGAYTLFVPAAVLAPHLSPEWAARLVTTPAGEG
jgi:hypothetical protein